jgi:hypothetical protein
LKDLKLQESYYAQILSRYMAFCSASSPTDLAAKFASLSLASTDTSKGGELSTLLSAMRALREGIVASGRRDSFAQQVYMFTIRAAILARSMESYHPALLYLLRRLHSPSTPLSRPDLSEFATYLVLDLGVRQRNFGAALEERHKYKLTDSRLDAALRAVIHDDYVLFWRTLGAVDGYRAALLQSGAREMRRTALKCLAKTYFKLEVDSVLRATGEQDWEVLRAENDVGWAREGDVVVLRRPKG